MAAQFGKREKIVVGAIALIGSIAALHFFQFQERAAGHNELLDQYNSAKSQALDLPSNIREESIATFEQETADDERLLWRAIADMNLILPAHALGEEPPEEPEDKEDVEAIETYNKAMAEYQERSRPLQVQAEAEGIERFRRLIRMKAAFEEGEPWLGEDPPPAEEGGRTPHIMKLSFLGEGETGWNLPLEPNRSLRPKDKMWDEVDHLYGFWDVLNLLEEDSADFDDAYVNYVDQLAQMGLDINIFPAVEEWNTYLPEFIKALHARMIWDQREEGEEVTIGRGEEMSLDLLYQMYSVEIPAFHEFFALGPQLRTLEAVLPIARKHRILDVQHVVLIKERPLAFYPDTEQIERAKNPVAIKSTPAPRGLASITDSRRGPRRIAMATPTRSESSAAPLDPANIGAVALVWMRFEASNENAMRFLYDLINDPSYYRLDGLNITALESGNVLVDVTLDVTIVLWEVSMPDVGLVDEKTLEPLREIGKEIMEAKRARTRELGTDMGPVLEEALREQGLPTGPAESASDENAAEESGGPEAAVVEAPPAGD